VAHLIIDTVLILRGTLACLDRSYARKEYSGLGQLCAAEELISGETLHL
jgi:hypothetical protein